jgi:RHS repeat-associated protein
LNFIRHKDWLGSSRLATTWAHAVYSKEAYAPFGETYNEWGTPDRSFTGQDQNIATGSGGTGTYDFLFRKFDPSAGRWLSPDPLGWGAVNQGTPQSLNRYAYVLNNPMSLTDPDGQACVTSLDGAVSIDNQGPIGDACTGMGGIYVPGDMEVSDIIDLFNGNLSFYIANEDGGPNDFYGAVQAGIDNRGPDGQISNYDSTLLAQMRDTLWGGDWSGDYYGNLPNSQWFANGNITPYDPKATNNGNGQDGVCSLGSGAFAGWVNSQAGMLSACQAHDSGYENEHCNATSWLGVLPGACTMVNAELVIQLVPEFFYYGGKWLIRKIF